MKKEKHEKRILFLGLDNAGKSTILEKMFNIKNTGPTFGYKIYQIENLIILDVGGQGIIRRYWNNYYEDVDGVIFVYDLTDPREFIDIFDDVRADPNLIGARFLLMGNKKDLIENVPEYKFKKVDFDVVYVSAKKNEGIKEAIDNFISKL